LRRWAVRTHVVVWGITVAALAIPIVAYNVMLRMPGKSYAGPLPPLSAQETALNDSLYEDLHHLATTIGERNVLHPDRLALARDWIEERLRSAGYATDRQTYDVNGIACSNVVAERKGTSRAGEIVIVGAHYDSADGTPGANDNGSGLVSLLALARDLAGRSFDRSVRYVAFVNEEPPFFLSGSAVYAKRAASSGERIVAMLSLETMGFFSDEPGSQKYPFPMSLLYPDTGNFITFVGNIGSRDLVRRAIGSFREATSFPSEGAALPESMPGVGWSDHGSFWAAGYPAIMVTDTAFFRYRHYHTAQDTEDKVDTGRLARVVAGLERVVKRLAAGSR
jgi:hypothetical protein